MKSEGASTQLRFSYSLTGFVCALNRSLSQIVFDNEHALMLSDPPVPVPGPLEQLLAIPPSYRDEGRGTIFMAFLYSCSTLSCRLNQVHCNRSFVPAFFSRVQSSCCGSCCRAHDLRHRARESCRSAAGRIRVSHARWSEVCACVHELLFVVLQFSTFAE
jgi:hypothetical protein